MAYNIPMSLLTYLLLYNYVLVKFKLDF